MMFRRDRRGPDPRWDIAASTPVFVGRRDAVDRLASEHGSGGEPGEVDGVLRAVPHPTGWFLSAVRRADLEGEDLPCFHEVVTVRAYLLLWRGPESPVWRRTVGGREWRSTVTSLTVDVPADVADLDG